MTESTPWGRSRFATSFHIGFPSAAPGRAIIVVCMPGSFTPKLFSPLSLLLLPCAQSQSGRGAVCGQLVIISAVSCFTKAGINDGRDGATNQKWDSGKFFKVSLTDEKLT